jgi:hypothetical protein
LRDLLDYLIKHPAIVEERDKSLSIRQKHLSYSLIEREVEMAKFFAPIAKTSKNCNEGSTDRGHYPIHICTTGSGAGKSFCGAHLVGQLRKLAGMSMSDRESHLKHIISLDPYSDSTLLAGANLQETTRMSLLFARSVYMEFNGGGDGIGDDSVSDLSHVLAMRVFSNGLLDVSSEVLRRVVGDNLELITLKGTLEIIKEQIVEEMKQVPGVKEGSVLPRPIVIVVMDEFQFAAKDIMTKMNLAATKNDEMLTLGDAVKRMGYLFAHYNENDATSIVPIPVLTGTGSLALSVDASRTPFRYYTLPPRSMKADMDILRNLTSEEGKKLLATVEHEEGFKILLADIRGATRSVQTIALHLNALAGSASGGHASVKTPAEIIMDCRQMVLEGIKDWMKPKINDIVDNALEETELARDNAHLSEEKISDMKQLNIEDFYRFLLHLLLRKRMAKKDVFFGKSVEYLSNTGLFYVLADADLSKSGRMCMPAVSLWFAADRLLEKSAPNFPRNLPTLLLLLDMKSIKLDGEKWEQLDLGAIVLRVDALLQTQRVVRHQVAVGDLFPGALGDSSTMKGEIMLQQLECLDEVNKFWVAGPIPESEKSNQKSRPSKSLITTDSHIAVMGWSGSSTVIKSKGEVTPSQTIDLSSGKYVTQCAKNNMAVDGRLYLKSIRPGEKDTLVLIQSKYTGGKTEVRLSDLVRWNHYISDAVEAFPDLDIVFLVITNRPVTPEAMMAVEMSNLRPSTLHLNERFVPEEGTDPQSKQTKAAKALFEDMIEMVKKSIRDKHERVVIEAAQSILNGKATALEHLPFKTDLKKLAHAYLVKEQYPEAWTKAKAHSNAFTDLKLLHLKRMVMYTRDNVDALLPGLAHRFVKGHKNEPGLKSST